jgi:hypothetical protein
MVRRKQVYGEVVDHFLAEWKLSASRKKRIVSTLQSPQVRAVAIVTPAWYTVIVSKKWDLYTFEHHLRKYWPVLKILSQL